MGARVLMTMLQHRSCWTGKSGQTNADRYCFPFGNTPSGPKWHITTLKRSWETVRDEAGIEYRRRNLRHSFRTKLAEDDVPEINDACPDGTHEPRDVGALLAH